MYNAHRLMIDGGCRISEASVWKWPDTDFESGVTYLYGSKASNQDWNSAIALALRSGGYPLRKTGDHFGLYYSSVSGIIKNLQKIKT